MATRKREQYLKNRISGLLKRIVTTAKTPASSEITTIGDLELNLSQDGHSKLSSIERWINGDAIPDSEDAWHLGEELSAAGMLWMNGLAMLWFCGHYEDFIGTLAFLGRAAERRTQNDFCRFLDSLRTLTTSHPLDASSKFFDIYVRSKGNDPNLDAMLAASNASDEDKIAFIRREVTKQFQLDFVVAYPTMLQAFETWQPSLTFTNPRRPQKPPRASFSERTHLERLISAAMEIARSPNLSVPTTETATYAVLSEWARLLDQSPWDVDVLTQF
jgi:hypothetical protein